ncbi:hypothetical protein [Thioclava sp. GXIMD2076]|uniref:DUF1127 domain-containing protein n=1 Tax=Thioclava kandeliae TaxID=3070818 RepID=A0ABV1SC81_9RHOB
MASFVNTAHKSSLGSVIARMFQKAGRALVLATEAKSRQSEIVRLNAMSDAQLAMKGIARDEIVAHVYRDRLYA